MLILNADDRTNSVYRRGFRSEMAFESSRVEFESSIEQVFPARSSKLSSSIEQTPLLDSNSKISIEQSPLLDSNSRTRNPCSTRSESSRVESNFEHARSKSHLCFR